MAAQSETKLNKLTEVEKQFQLFQWLLHQPAVKAQAYFWNHRSRTERRKAMLRDMKEATK